MPRQEEHDKPENLVESPHEAEQAARSLEDAVDSHASLQGYYAMNNIKPSEEVEKQAAEDRKKPENREKGHPVP
jgi:hypothetical protein